jgi:RNA polymerase sigma-70 factor (ECF subfamily)
VAGDQDSYEVLERVFREEAGRLTASLVRLLGDFDLAEELVSDAVVEALTRWPRDGVPERPTSWLLTTAKRKGLDRLRRQARYREKLAELSALPPDPTRDGDDRLQLIFICCHPALTREAQIALTLRAVVGLTTEEIARAFMVSEETLAKRVVRAKRKIVESGIAYRIPEGEELLARLGEVLAVIYLVFNEGYLATAGPAPIRRDLARDAEWLASLLMHLLPEQPEVMGLVALIRLNLARWPARLDAEGRLVLIEDQDRSLWEGRAIVDAVRLIERASAVGRPGPYLIEACIAAVHCEARSWEETDWPQILALYTTLAGIDPSPVLGLNRAIAVSHVHGPQAALDEVEAVAGRLGRYYLLHATRAVLLRRLGRVEEADMADARAIELTSNEAERALMSRRLSQASAGPPSPAGSLPQARPTVHREASGRP